jgi:Arc/MetJ family transcription regulator
MRTTITLDDDVAALLKRIGQGRRIKFKELVNLALREGLKHLSAPKKKRTSFRTASVNLGSCRAGHIDNVAEVLAVAEGESFK